MTKNVNIIDLDDKNFEIELGRAGGVVLVDFWASWCAPCRMMAPLVDEMAGAYKSKLKVAKLNVEESRDVVSRLGITNVPTFIFFKDGEEVFRFSGVVSKKDFERRIEKIISA